MKIILYCKKCSAWKYFNEGNWKKLTNEDWFEIQFKPNEYGISPVVCPKCKEEVTNAKV